MGWDLEQLDWVMGVHHTTVISWVKQIGDKLDTAPPVKEIPEITQIDELQTFIGKKNKIWIWTTVDKYKPGIIDWVVGDRSNDTFRTL